MQNNQFSAEQLDSTANQLIAERGDQLDDAAKNALKEQIIAEISDAIDKAFIDALPPDCLKEMAKLADESEPSEEQFNAIMAKANLDNTTIINTAIDQYRQKFLNKA